MIAGFIAIAMTLAGLALIATGVSVSLADHKKQLEADGKVTAEGTSGEILNGLAKLAEALRDYPLGMQLVFLGVGLLIAAGATGGIAAVAS